MFKSFISNLREVSLYKKIEKKRYETIGEMSALIAHDLGNPLNTILFCAETLKDGVPEEKKGLYHEQLEMNLNRALELVRSIKSKVKSIESDKNVNFYEAHVNVVNLLATQFRDHKKEFSRIRFAVDEKLKSTSFEISSVDMIHILDNLYRNAIKNLIENKITDPQITIEKGNVKFGNTEIFIRDNGTGLSKSQFERYTKSAFINSLGLKLIRRLTEYNGGSLDVVDAKNGTTFCLHLKEIR